MRCPSCDARVQSPNERWRAHMKAVGFCQRCGKPVERIHEPTGKKFAHCNGCLLEINKQKRLHDARSRRAGGAE